MALTLSTEDFQAIFKGVHPGGKVWFIAPAEDSPSGAGTYPGDEDAWADIAASVVSGDTIILKPSANPYPAMNLSALTNVTVIGRGALTVVTVATWDGITVGSGCKIRNVAVTATDAARAAIWGNNVTDVLVDGCVLTSADSGLRLNGFSTCRLLNTRIAASEYGVVLGESSGPAVGAWAPRSFIENCDIQTRDWSSCSTAAVTIPGGLAVIIRNCHLDARSAAGQPAGEYAVALNVTGNLVLVEGCTLVARNSIADGGSGRLGVGVSNANVGGMVQMTDSFIQTSGGTGEDSPCDFYIAGGDMFVNDSVRYDPAKIKFEPGYGGSVVNLSRRDVAAASRSGPGHV